MRDAILSASNLISFPVSTGITSSVYKAQKTSYFNNFNQFTNAMFVADIDNIQSIEKIQNLAISGMKREDGSTIGIIQLYNKMSPIMPKDIRKLDAITRFFGGCVQNVEDKTKKLTTTLTVQLETPECVEYLNNSAEFFE